MSVVLPALAVLVALIGHAALWVGTINRIHAIGAPRFLVMSFTVLGYAMLVFAPPTAFVWWLCDDQTIYNSAASTIAPGPTWYYLVLCWIVAAGVVVLWIPRHLLRKPPVQVISHRTTLIDVAEQLDAKLLTGLSAQVLSYFPGNQVLQIAVEEYELAINRLPTKLDGFSILLLTDWHITGRIGKEYFAEIVRQANAINPNLIAICGDLSEDSAHFDWLSETIAQLRARDGIYFVLGNHDLFTHDAPRLRRMLTDAGLNDLGGCWKRLEIAGSEIILAGNELPWFSPAADMRDCPPRGSERKQLRILLSHSPDQFAWARHCDFDLMLAGHTHGGQIRLPVVGPIFSPSLHGVKYASGTFFAEPTLMHVSRGISSELPIRLNCPPELAKLVLRCPASQHP
jgi:uncharacterized protein